MTGALLLILALPHFAVASEVTSRLERLSRDLTKAYTQARGSVGLPSIAVFTFNSSDELAKRRAGFAISELLTHHLANQRTFTVVERAELSQVMEEQKLHLSGVIDPSTAVRIGKVVGARLILVGSIEKLTDRYGVNARIVDAETSEVIATAYEDFPAQYFEEAAKPYLVLVPESQAIGLYLLYDYRYNGNHLSAWRYQSSDGYPADATPNGFPLGMIGGGLRYFPLPRWMVDFSAAVLSNVADVASGSETYPPYPPHSVPRRVETGRTVLIRGNLNWVSPSYYRFHGIAGAGVSVYRIAGEGLITETAYVPTLRVGAEYRPQSRIGLGVFLNYDLRTRNVKDATDPSHPDVVKLQRFSIEPTIGVYF